MDPALVFWLVGIAFAFVTYAAMALTRMTTWRFGLEPDSDNEFVGTLVVLLVGIGCMLAGREFVSSLAGIFGFIGILAYANNRWAGWPNDKR